jgi:glutamyl-tRNA synthetase
MRVRFAPSPTGALHVGGARTALFNWLLARGRGGEMVLRIEDTDRKRSTQENVDQIFEALEWLGIDYDGEPVFQSQRAERHAEVIERLLAEGHAYRSMAGREEVDAWRAQHGNRGFRGEDQGEGAVRLRIPDGVTVVRDVIRGESEFANELQDDLVIARADGTPVYHTAVVVDDLDAGVTHVVRGADHYSNTPKQMLILAALGEEPPVYAHVPLLHGPDGKKLSKRHGAASVQELRDAGYLPEAVRNYLALLGWGEAGSEETFYSDAELMERFALERVSRSPAVFDEQKLRWMNGRYVRELAVEDLQARLEALLGRDLRRDVVEIAQEKISTLAEFWPLTRFFFEGPADDPAAREKVFGANGGAGALEVAREAVAGVEDWSVEGLESALRGAADAAGLKPKHLFQPVRVAISGSTISPGIFESVAVLGREETLRRIDAALTAPM